jgi:adenylate kinase family enzyme
MAATNYDLGTRIVVRGVTGSGKSTFTRALGAALGLKVIELDEIHWQRPNWEPLPQDEFHSQVVAALDAAPNGWVVDGNYSAVTGIVLERADTLIWINLPWRVSFYRLLKRTLPRAFTKELLWGVQGESIRGTFFSKNSILYWSISHHKATARRVIGLLIDHPHLQSYELRSAKEVAALLEEARRVAR